MSVERRRRIVMSETSRSAEYRSRDIVVWDRGVRFFHWLLVGSVTGALATGFFAGKPWLDFHVIFGVAIITLVVLRFIWGFLGSTYARFGSFVVSPGAAFRHLRGLFRGEGHEHLGHNPLGAWMIVTLLVVLAAVCATGVAVLGGVVKEGPLAPYMTFALGREVREIHEFLAYAVAGLVGLHIAGALFESWRCGENLPRAMVTGRKRPSPTALAAAPVRGHPLVAGVLALALAVTAGRAVAHYSALPAYRTPTEPLDPVYARECGACHTPHHPSLAPAATWRAIMSGLENHFGENAALSPEQTERLAAYLNVNAAETWDTRPANMLRRPNPKEPLRITAAGAWPRIHRHIPDEVFKSKPIGGKLNCSHCHGDAETGLFAPRAISIKREITK
jgi:cytochrome b